MIFELVILGNSSATPTLHRSPSAQYLKMLDHHMLIDCGEGTQVQMQRYKIRKSKIKHIFISHVHADHMLGLPGLIFSMNLMQRTEPLHIYGPDALFKILDLFIELTDNHMRFEIIKHVTQTEVKEVIFEDDELKVSSFPLYHRVPTTGFLFEEKERLRKLNMEACEKYEVPVSSYADIKKGKDYVYNGTLIPNTTLTSEPGCPISYAYCSDTRFDERVAKNIKGVNLLYHEATFLHDKLARAIETKHTTAKEAGIIAGLAETQKLLIGHFSSRYDVVDELLVETRAEFAESYVAEEGSKFTLC